MSATSKVFGSSELSGNIFEFLTLEDRLACRNANRDLRDNAVAFAHPSRTVFAVSWTRNAILDFLPPEDLDRCKRVKRSWRRNITEFQRVRLPAHFPEEFREIVRGARFQIYDGEDQQASIIAGYIRGMPVLACNVYKFSSGNEREKVLDYVLKRRDGSWFVAGARNATIKPRGAHMGHLLEFIRMGEYTPEWARPPGYRSCCESTSDCFRRIFRCPKRAEKLYYSPEEPLPATLSFCQRVCDIFRRLCGCPKPPEERYPQFRLCYPERDALDEGKGQNSK